MEPTGVELIPVVAIVLTAALFLAGLFLVQRFKAIRTIGDEPRPLMSTEPDLDASIAMPARELPPPPPKSALARLPSVPPTEVVPTVVDHPGTDGVEQCCACGQHAGDGLIEFEDWQQVERFWGRMLALLGYRNKIAPGRALYVNRRWCRSCAAIADHKNRLFLESLNAEFDARRRIWEQRGLVDAVKREIAIAERLYNEQLDELKRAETRARAREILPE